MTRSRLGMATVVLSLLILGAGVLPGEVPNWIAGDYLEETRRPLWVSAGEAAPNGQLDWDLLPAQMHERLRTQIETAKASHKKSGTSPEESPCATFSISGHSTRGEAHPPSSPRQIVNLSELIATGTISDLSPGFFRGMPSTLLEVTIDDFLKTPTGITYPEKFLVAYQGAAIPLEGVHYCVWKREGGHLPSVGGRALLLFEEAPPLDNVITLLEDHEIAFTLANGTTSLTSNYPEQGVDLSALILDVKEELKAGAE